MPPHRPLAALALPLLLAACSSAGDPAPPTKAVREPGRTVFLPHAGVPFDGKKVNAVWCATFPLAWEALGRDVLGGPVRLGAHAPADLVEGMNARPFPGSALSPAARVVAAGRLRDGVLDRIRREGREKFGIDLPRMPVHLRDPDDLLAYAFLRKDLPFAQRFETWERGMRFAGAERPVPAFGIREHSAAPAADLAAMRAQTSVLFHDPVGLAPRMAIEIRPKGGGDVLVLAAVPPAASLEATWNSVAATPRPEAPAPLREGEVLAVPKIHFDLVHRFGEFIGLPILNEGFQGYRITEAVQSVLFRLDEAGVLLESETVIGAKWEAAPQLRRFVFDRPFLLALREEGAKDPYLLLWIANPDLMPVDE